MPNAPSIEATLRPSSTFASERDAVKENHTLLLEFDEGQKDLVSDYTRDDGNFVMDTELSHSNNIHAEGTMKAYFSSTDSVEDWLKSPRFDGSAGIWFQSDTQEDPVGVKQDIQLTFAEESAATLAASAALAIVATLAF